MKGHLRFSSLMVFERQQDISNDADHEHETLSRNTCVTKHKSTKGLHIPEAVWI